MQRLMLGVFALLAGLLACFTSLDGAAAQNYPNRPITLVVPFPAGSTTDLVGRILADRWAMRSASVSLLIIAAGRAALSAPKR